MNTTAEFLTRLWELSDIPASVVAVSAFIASYGMEVVEVSDELVALRTGYCAKSVQRARAWMVEKGLVECAGGKWRGCRQRWTLKVDIKGGHTYSAEMGNSPSIYKERKVDIKGGQSCARVNIPLLNNNIDNIDNNIIIPENSACAQARTRTRTRTRKAREDVEVVGGLGLEIEEPKKKRTTFNPPTLDEVRNYFSTRSGVLANWIDEAGRFFDYWDGIDWYQRKGVRLVKWQGRADRWIETVLEEQKNQSNGKRDTGGKQSAADRQEEYARYFAERYARGSEDADLSEVY